ncbi:MAG: 2,5-diamino-6-(ribosylamino)-4(3H)-pyrimidinone 5'-phosphate reductase [Methanobrevibacter arboriphilus]|uniref:2,5-diamino-6-(ribosylamino)-4(3H)-pyrimidinone 5'-phosphate reductase n=1 Tax=Methanobrevibacter arboriphilus TaxID=39441 RepID=A0A843AIV2_METAZ|nr:2,5-diamino-6-(ribosylamino)-4(3H)-pyrimidinone 5'-phosphate reductase [Methanobrevibacter arboriphilus]MBF4468985.1 2,5-diamino-6-(ribosylamino)-4(3H)-pyrimidinone 5'-phosphate reductase [Methanobrevibacter arboriphilus]
MRPYVILNAAMTLDGKIATKTGSSEISGLEDLKRVHELRKEVDGIMVGINTVLMDDPRLTVHKITSKKLDNPIRVVVDNKARTPIESRILNDDALTIIAVSNKVETDNIIFERSKALSEKADVFYSKDPSVNLKELMKYLYSKKIKTLMLEGGSTLNFSMLRENLIDEIRVCVAPMVVGGKYAKTLFDGDGFDFMKEAINLELKNSYQLGKDLVLEYKVL